MQREMVEDLVQVRWKIRRIPAIEAERMWREQKKIAADHAQQVAWRYLPKDSEPDLCPIKILASEFACKDQSAFNRLDLYRARLERQMHTLLRELRKLREETGNDEDQEDQRDTGLPRDTGLRPVQEDQETCEQRPLQTEPTQSGPEARVTGEQVAATENAI